MENISLEKESNKENRTKRLGLSPTQVLALGMLGFILLGTVLLSLPIATVDGQGAPVLTALFTATSAVCVNGLVVVDTGTYYTVFGQLLIVLMAQIGGLGFMTFATLFAILLGRKITLKERMVLQEALQQMSLEGIVRLAKYVIQITLVVEAAGALILTLRWAPEFGWAKAAYYGIFHAVVAFNNSGFDLFGGFRSLTMYVSDPIVNIVVAVLIIIGGLGFLVLSELYVERGRHLHLHSQIVLRASFWLVIIGTITIFLLEVGNPNTMAGLNPLGKVLASFFQAVSARSGGFTTLPLAELRDTTQLFLVVLMFIGASPGSTGGGIKTTTFVTIFLAIKANFQGNENISIRERTLPRDIVQKAFTLTFVALTVVVLLTGILSMTEDRPFLPILFEVVSAFSTTGWSMGITPTMTNFGKFALVLAMFMGRIGPLTLAFALTKRAAMSQAHIKYPEERIMIG